MKRLGPAIHVVLVLGVAATVALLAARPQPPLPPLPAARNLHPPPKARRGHDLDLTVVSLPERKPAVSTAKAVTPRRIRSSQSLLMVPTMEHPRRYFVSLFVVDSRGAVAPVTPTKGKTFIWKKPADDASYPLVFLPAISTPGDLLLRAFLAFDPFQISRSEVKEAIRRAGRPPLDARPLPVAPPAGRAGATFTQMALRILRGP